MGIGPASCPPLSTGDATTLTIKASDDSPVVFKDVLIGDVWICSGQSNMGFEVKEGKDAAKEIESANYPQIRMLKVPHVTSVDPTTKLDAKWQLCSPQTVADWTAVGYFFGAKFIRPKAFRSA